MYIGVVFNWLIIRLVIIGLLIYAVTAAIPTLNAAMIILCSILALVVQGPLKRKG